MPSPHFNITITKRSKGKSAVAGAAYQSGSRIFSEYDQKYKDYTRKQGIIIRRSCDVRVNLRSYERQGLDIISTVHMGPAVMQMERRGIATNIGNLNRDIRAANRLLAAIRSTIKGLREWIAEIRQAQKEAVAETETPRSPALAGLLTAYMDLRKQERREWSGYGK